MPRRRYVYVGAFVFVLITEYDHLISRVLTSLIRFFVYFDYFYYLNLVLNINIKSLLHFLNVSAEEVKKKTNLKLIQIFYISKANKTYKKVNENSELSHYTVVYPFFLYLCEFKITFEWHLAILKWSHVGNNRKPFILESIRGTIQNNS